VGLEHTFKQLLDEAGRKGLKGRSRVNTAELEQTLKK
jgi:hypothetical protein